MITFIDPGLAEMTSKGVDAFGRRDEDTLRSVIADSLDLRIDVIDQLIHATPLERQYQWSHHAERTNL